MPKYNRTIKSVIITPDNINCSPLYSKQSVTVTLTDEGGGPFILLKGDFDSGEELRLDIEDLEIAAIVARELIDQASLATNTMGTSDD